MFICDFSGSLAELLGTVMCICVQGSVSLWYFLCACVLMSGATLSALMLPAAKLLFKGAYFCFLL